MFFCFITARGWYRSQTTGNEHFDLITALLCGFVYILCNYVHAWNMYNPTFWFILVQIHWKKKFPKSYLIYSKSATGRYKYYRHLLKLQKTLNMMCKVLGCIQYDIQNSIFRISLNILYEIICVWEIFARFARASLSQIFLTANQSSRFMFLVYYFQNFKLDCQKKLLQTKFISRVNFNCKIKLSQIKVVFTVFGTHI